MVRVHSGPPINNIETETGSRKIGFFKRYPLKGYDFAIERGKKNQHRAIRVAESMAEEGIYQRVKRATKKQDTKGIDFWIYPNDRNYRIPVQVKSSVVSARDFRLHRENPEEIAVFVVNDVYSDRELRGQLIKQVARWTSINGPKMRRRN